jgi:hypothetical protein
MDARYSIESQYLGFLVSSVTVDIHQQCVGKAEALGECSIHYEISSDKFNPFPFDLFTATVDPSLFVCRYLSNNPYSSEVMMRIASN